MWRPLLLLIVVAISRAHGQIPCVLESSHDGNGLYTYTFDRGDVSYAWGFLPNNGYISIQSFEVVEVVTPPGWTSTANSNGVVTLSLDVGAVYFEAPVSFSIRSASTTASNYLFTTFGCEIFSGVYSIATHDLLAGGYQAFDYVGPEPGVRLQVARSGTNAVLNWPVTANRYILETISDLGKQTNAWKEVTDSPVLAGWQKFVTNAFSDGNRLYRLRRD
jgi:hypothetical protein